MSTADDKRYYVLTLRGDLGPFDRATLAEKLHEGAVRPVDQVRNAFGRVQGTVAETLELRPQRPASSVQRPGEAPRSGPQRVADAPRAAPHRPDASRGGLRWLPVAVGAALLVLIVALALARRVPDRARDSVGPPAMAPKPLAMAPKPVQAAPPPAPVAQLVIRRAVYGVLSGSTADVTRIVAAAVREDKLSIRVNNAIFGDPVPGTAKKLKVTYLWCGEERSKTVEENDLLTILDQGR